MAGKFKENVDQDGRPLANPGLSFAVIACPAHAGYVRFGFTESDGGCDRLPRGPPYGAEAFVASQLPAVR